MWTPAALFFLFFLFFLDCAFSLLPPSVPPTPYLLCDYLAARDSLLPTCSLVGVVRRESCGRQ